MEKIEYLRLLLNGFINHNEHFKEHIKREIIKAKEKHIFENEFFDECFNIIKIFENELDKQLNNEKREFYLALNSAKNGTLLYDYDNTNLSEEEKRIMSIKEIENELKLIDRYRYTVHLNGLTNNEFTGHLYYNDVLFIEKNIVILKGLFDTENSLNDLAKNIVKNRIEKGTFNKQSKKELTFKDLFSLTHNSDKKLKGLKDLLRNNGYIDNKNIWCGVTKNKNELAFLYHYLKGVKDKENNSLNIIKTGAFNSQIKVFYKEFGLIVYDDKDENKNGYVTVKNLKKYNIDNDTINEYKRIFSLWI